MAGSVGEVIHEHYDHAQSSERGMGIFVLAAIVVLMLLMLLFFYYGLPYLRNLGGSQINIPVPDKIDVNLNQK